jgi:hypothetical protein
MALLLNASEVELIAALNKHGVRYLVVGGHAVMHHGHLRVAKDLDLWIEASAANAQRIADALATVRFALNSEAIERLSKPKLQMRLSTLHTELLSDLTGIDFPSAYSNSVSAIEGGVPCRVIGKADLIANKRIVGRNSDLEDIAALEAVGHAG